MDGDLQWLLKYIPKEDTLGAEATLVSPIFSRITKLLSPPDEGQIDHLRLPFTIGLFGPWGSGKTTVLSYLAKELIQCKGQKVVYFNAWKYANFMEIVPSLIYKILTQAIPSRSKSKRETVARIMLSLGTKYAEDIGEWVKNRFAINPAEVFKDVLWVRKELSKSQEEPSEFIREYYTQLDKAQDLILDVLRNQPRPIVVLVDELDRCDPGEAFEVIKQLRVFFAMRGAPLIFVVSANPEPVGMAIKHKYGLTGDGGDYEARRILEKFVDAYVDLSEARLLGSYIAGLWQEQGYDEKDTSFIATLDARRADEQIIYELDTVKNAGVFQAMSTGNPLYCNLRVLRKSFDYVFSPTYTLHEHLRWTSWHLEILKHMHSGLRRKIWIASKELALITKETHLAVLTELARSGNLDPTSRKLKSALNLQSNKGNTCFSTYRSWFWEQAKDHASAKAGEDSSEEQEVGHILRELMSDHRVMDFVIIMTLVSFCGREFEPVYVSSSFSDGVCSLSRSADIIENWEEIDFTFEQLGYLLANY